MPSLKTSQIPALTGFRAIAAALVFFYHWFFSYVTELPLPIRAPFEIGYVGVPMFFALSGFLITARYCDDFARRRITFGAYLAKRFTRIYPLYFAVLTLLVIALQRPEGMIPKDLRGYAATYTLTQALFPSLLLIGTTVGWTLTIEEMFYFIAPGLMRWLDQPSWWAGVLPRALALSAVALAAGWGLSSLNGGPLLQDTLVGAPATYLLHYSLFGHLPDFLAGMVSGLIYLRRDTLPNLTRWASPLIWLSVAGAYACMVATVLTNGPLGSPLNRTLTFGVALFSSSALLGMACDSRQRNLVTRALSWKPIVYLGTTSYALYLIQLTQPCQWLYWSFFGDTLGIADRIARAVLSYAGTAVLAAGLYELIEHPAQQWLNTHLVRRIEQPPRLERAPQVTGGR